MMNATQTARSSRFTFLAIGKRLAPSLLAAFFVFTPASRAAAYCQTTSCADISTCNPDREEKCKPLRWTQMPLPYRFHQSLTGQLPREETKRSIRAAFGRWADVECAGGARTSLRFVELEETDRMKALISPAEATERGIAIVRGPDPYAIYFRDTGWPIPKGVNLTIAVTHLFHTKDSPIVTGSDMEVNSSDFLFAIDEDADETTAKRSSSGERKDLEAVMTHEIGHYIGLAHSDAALALMSDGYCKADGRCEDGKRVRARRLSADEQQGVCALYPPGAPPPEPGGKPGCETATGETSHVPWLLCAGIGAFITILLRRKKHAYF